MPPYMAEKYRERWVRAILRSIRDKDKRLGQVFCIPRLFTNLIAVLFLLYAKIFTHLLVPPLFFDLMVHHNMILVQQKKKHVRFPLFRKKQSFRCFAHVKLSCVQFLGGATNLNLTSCSKFAAFKAKKKTRNPPETV